MKYFEFIDSLRVQFPLVYKYCFDHFYGPPSMDEITKVLNIEWDWEQDYQEDIGTNFYRLYCYMVDHKEMEPYWVL